MNMTTGRRGIVWKTPDITADGLKMFACIVMLIQTVGIAVIEKGTKMDRSHQHADRPYSRGPYKP